MLRCYSFGNATSVFPVSEGEVSVSAGDRLLDEVNFEAIDFMLGER